jgi:hypothetical protein
MTTEDSPLTNLAFTSTNRWKRLRSIMNPTFSPAKLKDLMPALRICSDRLVNLIEKNIDNEIDFSDHIGRMTMDAVFNCLFGVDVDVQSDPSSMYLTRTRAGVQDGTEFTAFYKFLSKKKLYFQHISKMNSQIFLFAKRFFTSSNHLFWDYLKH